MFTGIVEELGTVVARDGERLIVVGAVASADATIGDSLAVDGVCLTVVDLEAEQLSFDLSRRRWPHEPRLARSRGRGEPGATGHARFSHRGPSRAGARGWCRRGDRRPTRGRGRHPALGATPSGLLRHVVEKGSITLDGVSLTVAALDGEAIEVALIPHTLRVTTLGSVRESDRVNVEVDIVAKYVARNLEYLTADGAAVVRPRKERTA